MTEFAEIECPSRRYSDKVAELTNELAFVKKVCAGHVATINRLDAEIVKAREEANRVMRAALGSLRK